MTPVVNGLADEYETKVEFRSLNAGFGEGQSAFNSYGLCGHPSYIILNPDGDVLWRGFGPQAREILVSALEDAIATYNGPLVLQETVVEFLPTLEPFAAAQDESSASPVPTLNPQLVARGEQLYQQQCSACHGINLEGQPDWKNRLPDGSYPAPPHDSSGHTWHHSDAVLLEIIAEGGDPAFGATMQGFAEVINEQEMLAVLEFIKSRWGPEERELQWSITSRDAQ